MVSTELVCGLGDVVEEMEETMVDVSTCFSFWRLRLLRRHLRDALAKCHALLGLMLIGG